MLCFAGAAAAGRDSAALLQGESMKTKAETGGGGDAVAPRPREPSRATATLNCDKPFSQPPPLPKPPSRDTAQR